VLSVVRQVSRDEPAWPSTDHPATPWELEAVCKRAMAKAPSARYPSAAALRDDLDRYLQGAPTHARAGLAASRSRGRARWLAAGGATLAAGALAALAAFATRAPEAQPASAPPPPSAPARAAASAPPTPADTPSRLPL